MPPLNLSIDEECVTDEFSCSLANIEVAGDTFHFSNEPQRLEIELPVEVEDDVEKEGGDTRPKLHRPEQRRNVRFDLSMSIIHIIPSLDDYTFDEIRSTWYMKSEYKVIRQSCHATIQLMKLGCYFENDRVCFRGFECKQKDESTQRRAMDKMKAETAVLVEQERQFQCGMVRQPDLIADAYRSCTVRCRFDAFKLGLRDCEAATESANAAVKNECYFDSLEDEVEDTKNDENELKRADSGQ